MKIWDKLLEIVFIKEYKKVLFIPIILFIIIVFPFVLKYLEGKPVFNYDITITGGYLIKFDYNKTILNKIKECNVDYDILYSLTGKSIVEIRTESKEKLNCVLDKLKNYPYVFSKISGEIGKNLIKNLLYALIFSFILVTIVVYWFFRSFLPTMSIVLSTILTLIETLMLLQLSGVKISTIVIGSLLMIFGYSVGSDSILGVYLFKREGLLVDRIKQAFNIVIKQETTTLLVFILLFLLSISLTVKQISLTAIYGIIFDLINTWLFTGQIQRIILEWKSG